MEGSNPPRLSLESVVCCEGEVSATSRSLVQRNPTECGMSECDRGPSKRRPRASKAVELRGKRKVPRSKNKWQTCDISPMCDMPYTASSEVFWVNPCNRILQKMIKNSSPCTKLAWACTYMQYVTFPLENLASCSKNINHLRPITCLHCSSDCFSLPS